MTTSSDDTPRDLLSITAAEFSTAKLHSDFLSYNISSRKYDDVDFGIDIHQDGPNVALCAGTNWTSEDGPIVETYHGLTVDQARQVAQALEDAADRAEEASTGAEAAAEDSESFIRRLMP